MKRPDLLILIAIWEFITAFFALIGISAIAVFVFPDALAPMWGPAVTGAVFGLSVAVLVLLCYIGIALAGGIGLLRGQEWGRVLGIAHAALSLFFFPIGTVIGILIIIYLTKSEIAEYFKAGGAGQ
jgi:hypothetical protein